jgi:hypothetical protein
MYSTIFPLYFPEYKTYRDFIGVWEDIADLTQNICTNKMLMNEHKIDQQKQEEVALRWGIAGESKIWK